MDDVQFRIAVAAELLDVQHSIVVSISNAITRVERVKPVQYFPAIGDVVSIAVGKCRVGAGQKLGDIIEAITVAIAIAARTRSFIWLGAGAGHHARRACA